MEKRIVDERYFDYYFLSEGVKVFDEIETFVNLCLKDPTSEQIGSFFSRTIVDVFRFRNHIKQFFSTWSEEKQEQAISCYKALVKDHRYQVQPPQFPQESLIGASRA